MSESLPNATSDRSAWGWGLATVSDNGTVLDARFPQPRLGPARTEVKAPSAWAGLDQVPGNPRAHFEVRRVVIDLDTAPKSTPDAYLRLHLLSTRLVRPNGLNLDGIFGVLANVVWTDRGPFAVDGFDELRAQLMARGEWVTVLGVDKFPRMVDYVVPSGVRIADADRVRLGAHLAPGTTVMHEGFVNYNAGTLGASMVEGRISQGVVVGDGSDIGGGASIMGTLSGGGRQVVSIGRRSLLGANAGIGISVGDDCIVESGLYVTAGTKVTLIGQHDGEGRPVVAKARDLSGASGLLFRRNSQTGAVEAVSRTGAGVALNETLHAN